MRDQNHAAYNAGHEYSELMGLDAIDQSEDRGKAYGCYRFAVKHNKFDPSVSASVCFVAGFLGNPYPKHDDRVTS